MNTDKAREYFRRYAPSVAFIEVRNKLGDIEIGSAYHIGEGVFVTARHVLDVPKILKIATTVNQYSEVSDGKQTLIDLACELKIEKGPFYHEDEAVDLACFIADKKDLPIVPLGSHLDDWIGDEMVLHTTLVLGYPPIPFSREPVLFATKAEVNAVIDKYTGGHPQFILSCMARGGLSGGLSINEYGFSMGIIVESLTKDNEPTELGYLSVISVEPIYVMLSHHEIMPQCIKIDWDYGDGTNLRDRSEQDFDNREANDEPF
ncbi:trypsin-like peptidase domain-containing protein [Fulvivirga sediminis]|uniref:Trypsin-like peptidase domain-containing protein n=1 Tax=Fulvivirga sediminis TaxID=2803949 RepID=A0A937FDY2_9BACT|nr:trypsin-like peptidase domain-containing protein [Fulvivirga sediminis]MBL3658768.1 trypsin-like peptidase domain-containing protein [Fulvivirga sediminis]